MHKTEVGGVRFVLNTPAALLEAWTAMMNGIPGTYARWIDAHRGQEPEPYTSLTDHELTAAIRADIVGILMCEFIPAPLNSFGDELFIGLRRTREFGTIISAGLGGLDTELFAATLRKGQSVATASVHLTTPEEFFALFRRTVSYKKLSGQTRDRRARATDEALLDCFRAFVALGQQLSPDNPAAPYWIDEFEVNPFAFAELNPVPLDGLCKFTRPGAISASRPAHKIEQLLLPRSIAVIGVSAKGMNMGRIILRNIINCGFAKDRLYVVRPGQDEIDGIRCVPEVASLPEKVDMFVMAVGADQVPDIVDQLLDNDRAESVILIPGGLGEKEGSKELEQRMKARIAAAHHNGGGPVFIGGNSLGIQSRPGRYDTLFIPESKLPKTRGGPGGNVAFLSQSGAFMISRMSKLSFYDLVYGISAGNQIDLTMSDLLRYLKDDPRVQVCGVYVEGFRDGDGIEFARAVRETLAAGKDVVFYKAGRTAEGRSATSGHTASIAGDYDVCEAIIQQAGACVAQTFTEFEELLMLASLAYGKDFNGFRVAGMSNAGFEVVGMADRLHGEDYDLELANFTLETRSKLAEIVVRNKLDALVDVKNPMDITPMSDDGVYAAIIQTMAEDPNVDVVMAGFVPLTPAMQTLPAATGAAFSPESTPGRMRDLVSRVSKPIIGVIDSGQLFDPMTHALIQAGLPTFRSADRAMWILARFTHYRQQRRGR